MDPQAPQTPQEPVDVPSTLPTEPVSPPAMSDPAPVEEPVTAQAEESAFPAPEEPVLSDAAPEQSVEGEGAEPSDPVSGAL